MDSIKGLWGHLLTDDQIKALCMTPTPQQANKRPRSEKETKGRDKGKPHHSTSQDLVQIPRETLQVLSRLVLKHEDSLNTMLQESEFLLYLSPGAGSILPTLLQTSRDWHNGTKTQPLRHLLATQMMQTLRDRLTKLYAAEPTTELYKECLAQHLLTAGADRTMPFLRWDPSQQSLVPTQEPGLPVEKVLQTLDNALRIMQDPGTTLRFHALKKQQNDENGPAIPWLWTISMRTSPELWSELNSLCFHSTWRLIQTRFRRQGLTRQPLAKQLAKTLTM